MKKILLFLGAMFLAVPAFAEVGISVGGNQVGTAIRLNLGCDTGSSITTDGSTYNANCNANFIDVGISNSGTTSMATTGLAVPLSYALVRKAIATSASGSFTAGTLANGEPGQVLTIQITAVGSGGTFVVTPTLSTGWTSVTFNTYVPANPQYVTLMYVNDTYGWIILGIGGSTVPTVSDINGV